MARTRWVIDLSSHIVGIMQIDGRTAVKWHEFEMPPTAYANGVLTDPKFAAETLKAEMTRAGLKIKAPTIVLSQSVTIEMQVSVPAKVRSKDLNGVIKNAAMKSVGGQIQEMAISWVRVRRGQINQSMYVVAARQDALDGINRMCAEAGFDQFRTVPFFLALRHLLDTSQEVVVTSTTDGHLHAVGVENGAPTVTGTIGHLPIQYGMESLLVSALHQTLQGAGPYSTLTGTNKITVVSRDADLLEAFMRSGYEAETIPRPLGCPNEIPMLGEPIRIPWPAAAIAWGAAHIAKPFQALSVAGHIGIKWNKGTVTMAALATMLVAQATVAGFYTLVTWPAERALSVQEKAASEQTVRSGKGVEDKVKTYNFLKEQNSKLEKQNEGITVTVFNWESMYKAVKLAAPPVGVELKAILPETAQAPPDTQAPKSDANAKTTESTADRPVLTVTGTADSMDLLTMFVESLKKAPFSNAQLMNAKLVPGASTTTAAQIYRPITAAPVYNNTPLPGQPTPPGQAPPAQATLPGQAVRPGQATSPGQAMQPGQAAQPGQAVPSSTAAQGQALSPAPTPIPTPAGRYEFTIKVRFESKGG